MGVPLKGSIGVPLRVAIAVTMRGYLGSRV